MSFFFSFLLFFFKLRERGGYIKLGIRRNGLKVYLSFFLFFFFFWWSSCGEYFLFYGLIDFMLFLILAWRNGSFVSEIFFSSSFTRSTWLWFRPPWTLVQQLTFLFPTSADGKESPFPFCGPSQSFGFSLLPPWLGDPLGLLYVTPYPIPFPSGHQVQTSVFPFWLGFVTLGLTHIPMMS